jgi:D-alanine transaminase
MSIVYFNGSYIEKEKVSISPDDRGFLFGDGTYEVIRVYQGRTFRLGQHLKRLMRSLREIKIDGIEGSLFEEVAQNLIKKNPEIAEDATLYIEITRGVAVRNHLFPNRIHPTIYASLAETGSNTEQRENGIKIILQPDERWGRCDIKSISLLANIMAAEEARRQDAYESVFVKDGMITEGTRTNIAAIFDKCVHTHPSDYRILGGITRDAVLEICRNRNIPVIEKPFTEKRLFKADEIFLMGTSTEIMPVIKVNETQIQKGLPGPITRTLQNEFRVLIA